MDRRFDPRSIVTPYAFAVHPDLLGRPLATPWQRLGAIVVDLIVIGFISQIGAAPLAIGSTALLFWLALRKPGREVFGKVFRIAVGCLGFLVLTVTILIVLLIRYGDEVQDIARELGADLQAESGAGLGAGAGDEEGAGGGQVGILDIVEGFQGVVALQNAATREEAQALMDDFVLGAFDAGLPRNQIRELLRGIVPDGATWAPDADGMVDEAIRALSLGELEDREDPGVEVQAGAGEPLAALSPAAADSFDRLNRAIRLAQEDRDDAQVALERTQRALEAKQDQGAFSWLRGFIDDLGIGFGWAALYLTVSHAWWRGTSLGKKLFRIRVVMIDKRPLNWWLSFERAGGYAAGFATGLLGFAQIFWDPNRQAIHDKVSETVVIQDGKMPVPGPWIEEGTAQWTRGRHGAQETPGA
ncbi:MAG: RDD family protein [Gemmatimonadota bacterium]